MSELGRLKLHEFAAAVVHWRLRPVRRRTVRPAAASYVEQTRRRSWRRTDAVWDDRADSNADQLVTLLFVAANPLRRSVFRGRRKTAVLPDQADAGLRGVTSGPPRGLRLEEAGDQLTLVTAPERSVTVERYVGQPPREPLSQAALETLAIIAYKQPVTRLISAPSAGSIATRWLTPFELAG